MYYEDTTYEYDAPVRIAPKRRIWPKVVLVISLITLLAAGGAIAYILFTYNQGEEEYESLTNHMQVTDKGNSPTLASFKVDWDALRAINKDVVGWVYLPDTVINYPIVWRENDDVYYTKHTFGDNSAGTFGAEYGAIALSGANSPKWTDEANFVSGHHMRNQTMFAILQSFQDSNVFNEHRTFYVLTPEGNFKLTSIAVDKVRGNSQDIVIPNFETKQEFHDYVTARINESKATMDPAYAPVDDIEQIIAFYTCSEPDNQYRIMVYCSVDEFLPAGSDETKGSALVESSDIENVSAEINERLS